MGRGGVALALAVGILFVSASSAGQLKKFLFSPQVAESKRAYCLDGTVAGYYYRASKVNSNNVVIFLQGGGACSDRASCSARINTTLGGSRNWKESIDDGNNFVSDGPENPLFADWHHVYVPYCSGDVHTGQWEHPNRQGLYFMGHHIVRAVADEIRSKLPSVGRLLLSGASAGGIGTIANVDFLAEYFSEAFTIGAPQAGLFFPSDVHTYQGFLANSTVDTGIQRAYLGHEVWKSYTNKRCLQAHQPPDNGCFDAWVVIKHIATPMFYFNNQFDSNQIYTQLGCPNPPNSTKQLHNVQAFIRYNGDRMRHTISHRLPQGAGVFAPACVNHTSNTCFAGSPRIMGKSSESVFTKWYNSLQKGVAGSNQHRVVEGCPDGNPCSTTCGHSYECIDPYQ